MTATASAPTSAPISAALPIRHLITDQGTMLRAGLNLEAVEDYAQNLQNLPDVVVFRDAAGRHILADGHHRVAAFKRRGRDHIPALIYPGELRDAILYAASANAKHGLRRTNADLRITVMAFLNDSEWSKWNDTHIARLCCVCPQTVTKYRPQFEGAKNPATTRQTQLRNGKVIQTRAFVPHARHHKPTATVTLKNGENGHPPEACCPKCGCVFPIAAAISG